MKANTVNMIICLVFVSLTMNAVSGLFTPTENVLSNEGETIVDREHEHTTASGLASTPWPCFGYDQGNTGLSPYDTSHVDGTEKWRYSTGGGVNASFAIDNDGIIYTGSDDYYFYALRPDGTRKWRYLTNREVRSSPAIGDDGMIYVGGGRRFYSLFPDGTENWNYTTSSTIYSSPTIGDDGTIYFGMQYSESPFFPPEGYLVALNPNGMEKWKNQIAGGEVFSSPAIGSDGTIYIGSDYGYLYAFNPNGSEKWTFTTGGYIYSPPSVDSNGTIYFGSSDNKLYAVHPDGSEKWTFTTGGGVYSSPAIGSDGTIYVGSSDNKLYAIDPDGFERWNFTTGGNVDSSPAIGSDGTIYFGSFDNKIYALTPDGTERWSHTTGGNVWSSPAIGADGTVYIGSNDNNVYAIGGSAIPPSITLTRPTGGETWYFGDEEDITWSTTAGDGAITGVDLFYSVDTDTSWTTIETDVPDTDNYTWTVPNEDSTECLVRVVVKDDNGLSGSDTSDSYFTIIGSAPPEIVLTQPAGGEEWYPGDHEYINWTTTEGDGNITHVDLWYSTDAGVSWSEIASGLNDTDSYGWSISHDPSTECYVRARIYDELGMTHTNMSAEFTILELDPIVVTVTRPEGGETWDADTMETITWHTDNGGYDDIERHELRYSTDNGTSWIEIDTTLSGGAGDHIYDWTIPDVNSEECLIRVHAFGRNSQFNVSSSGEGTSGAFTIIGSPPEPPTGLTVEHYGTPGGEELVTNGIFDTNYEPWTLTRPSTDGASAWDGTQTNSADGSGSITSSIAINARTAVVTEEGLWTQSIGPTADQITVNGAYRITRNNIAGNIIYNRGTIEILINDTSTGWQTIYSTGLLTTTQGWTSFGPDATYTPTGEVDQVRVRLLVEIETGGGGTIPNAKCYLWADDISVEAAAGGIGTDDNLLSWNASSDDPDKVIHYNIYRSDSSVGPWDETTLIDTVNANGSANYSYIDPGRGTADATIWWYIVRAVDIHNQTDGNENEVPETGPYWWTTFDIDLFAGGDADGWNFVSFNLEPEDTLLTTILDGIVYDKVMYYDASIGKWQSYVPGRAEHFNRLSNWNHSMGVWIHVTENATLIVEGVTLAHTDITLYPGWNMVGYPSSAAGSGVPVEITKVGYFNATATYNLAYDHEPTLFNFEPGQGYMLYNGADYSVTWTVEY